MCVCATSRDCLIWWWHVQVGEGCSWWQSCRGLFYRQVILNTIPTWPDRGLLEGKGNRESMARTKEAEALIKMSIHVHTGGRQMKLQQSFNLLAKANNSRVRLLPLWGYSVSWFWLYTSLERTLLLVLTILDLRIRSSKEPTSLNSSLQAKTDKQVWSTNITKQTARHPSWTRMKCRRCDRLQV